MYATSEPVNKIMPLIEATAADVLSLGTTLPSGERKPDLADRFDEIIRGIQASNVVYFPDASEGRTSRDQDVRAVAELVARLIHPANKNRHSHTTTVPIPPGWNNPGQEREETEGTIGTVAVHRSRRYKRDGVKRHGLVVWHGAYFAPGKVPQRAVFAPGNMETSRLKIVEFTPGSEIQETYVLPTVGDRLDTGGVFIMPEK